MKRHPKQRGSHTWDLTTHYHRCPSCGYVMENRSDYTYRLGKYIKELECVKCGYEFLLEKNIKPSIGPVFGNGSAPEVDWGD